MNINNSLSTSLLIFKSDFGDIFVCLYQRSQYFRESIQVELKMHKHARKIWTLASLVAIVDHNNFNIFIILEPLVKLDSKSLEPVILSCSKNTFLHLKFIKIKLRVTCTRMIFSFLLNVCWHFEVQIHPVTSVHSGHHQECHPRISFFQYILHFKGFIFRKFLCYDNDADLRANQSQLVCRHL